VHGNTCAHLYVRVHMRVESTVLMRCKTIAVHEHTSYSAPHTPINHCHTWPAPPPQHCKGSPGRKSWSPCFAVQSCVEQAKKTHRDTRLVLYLLVLTQPWALGARCRTLMLHQVLHCHSQTASYLLRVGYVTKAHQARLTSPWWRSQNSFH